MKGATWPRLIPANVAVNPRASVTAGFANEVDAVNQYAAAMYEPIAAGAAQRSARWLERTTKTSPNVATISLIHCPTLARSLIEVCSSGRSNMACASSTPRIAPMNCAARYGAMSARATSRRTASRTVTTGLKWAPLRGANATMSAKSASPVATELARSASALLPAGELLAHDSGSDHRREEQGGAEAFRERSAQERHLPPISSSDFLSECASSFATGSSSSSRMREESVVKAPRNARRLASSLPATAAGSGTPQ